jgi:hypothetical protein
LCYYLRRPTSVRDREPQHVRVGPCMCAWAGRHVRPIHSAAREGLIPTCTHSHLRPFPLA